MNATPTQHPDDLDRLFRAYFQRQVPDPFPPCPTVPVAEPASKYQSRQARPGVRSRLTLAASVAGLLGLGLTVSSGVRTPQAAKAPDAPDARLLQNSTADGAELLKHATPNATEPRNGGR